MAPGLQGNRLLFFRGRNSHMQAWSCILVPHVYQDIKIRDINCFLLEADDQNPHDNWQDRVASFLQYAENLQVILRYVSGPSVAQRKCDQHRATTTKMHWWKRFWAIIRRPSLTLRSRRTSRIRSSIVSTHPAVRTRSDRTLIPNLQSKSV